MTTQNGVLGKQFFNTAPGRFEVLATAYGKFVQLGGIDNHVPVARPHDGSVLDVLIAGETMS